MQETARTIPNQAGAHHRAVGRNVLLKNLAEGSRLFQMLFFVVIARRFGPGGLGDLTVLLMIGSIVVLVFGDLGINTTLIARMNGAAGAERERIASTALFWKVVLSALSFVLMIAAMRLMVHFGTWPEIFSVAVISVGGLWLEFLAALTNGVNRLGHEATLRHAYRAAVYGGGAVLAFFLGLAGVLIFMAAATVLVVLIALLLIGSQLTPMALPMATNLVPGFLREAAPVWLTQVAQLTYLKLDVVVLGVLHVAAREVGWYAAAWKIVDVLTTVPALMAAAVLPLISGALPDTDASEIAPGYLKVMYVLPFFFALPLAAGAEWITRVFYGGAFSGTPALLAVLVWGLVPVSVHAFLATLSVAVRRQREAAELGAATAVLGLAAAVILVPRLGYQAMAVISLVANSLFAIGMVYRFRNVTGSTHWSVGLKSLCSALAVYGLSLAFGEVPGWLLSICVVFGYGIALLLLRVIKLRDFNRGWRLAGSVLWNRAAERAGAA
ncbi:MAG TPA: polysaccharide biosynthesis C-terminal domain-containing protein [Terriglobia bacterium]|nr:polysaccharide biosynthesis C-terminal domain-containing protein [Terriglobia bacterium]